jgi:hypothetical protein
VVEGMSEQLFTQNSTKWPLAATMANPAPALRNRWDSASANGWVPRLTHQQFDH